MIAAAAVALVYLGTAPRPPRIQNLEEQRPVAIVPGEVGEEAAAAQPAEHIRFWQARVQREAISIPPRLGPAGLLGLGVLFVLGAFWLVYRHRKHSQLPFPQLARTQGGPGWMPLPELLCPRRPRFVSTVADAPSV